MGTAPTAATEVFVGLTTLHLQVKCRSRQDISLHCNDEWKPKSEGFGHAYMTQDMKEEHILQMGSDKMTPRHVYDKPFTFRFPDIRKWKSFNLGHYTRVLQADVYAIKACTAENLGMKYKIRNIYILADSQAAIKALGKYQITSKLVWDCHQSLIQLAKHKRVQLTWVPGHAGSADNELAYQSARMGSEHPCT
jgi:hypothetical protein